MVLTRNVKAVLAAGALLVLSGCGGGGLGGSLGSIGSIFRGFAPVTETSEDIVVENADAGTPPPAQSDSDAGHGNGLGIRLGNSLGSIGGIFGRSAPVFAASEDIVVENATAGTPPPAQSVSDAHPVRRGLFGRRKIDPNSEIQVNKYLWNASLEVLSFLPLQSADPFTGVLVTGFGTPPGGGRAYRATILIRDPALEARSLSVALVTRSGPASAATIRAVEDAILGRARHLRIGDRGL